MEIAVSFFDDPAAALSESRDFLSVDPVRNELVHWFLRGRVAHPEPGRYWVARRDGTACGVVFLSPVNQPAFLTPTAPDVASAMAEAIAAAGEPLVGVFGEVATAATFAGRWTELTKSAAIPWKGERLYEVRQVTHHAAPAGRLRKAGPADRDAVVTFRRDYLAEIGEQPDEAERSVDQLLPSGQYWLWEDSRPVSIAYSVGVDGVRKVGGVYTPPEMRNRGYASACVSQLSEQILRSGNRCILYADLDNPVSNSIYRRMGYRAVAELLKYRFETPVQ